MGRGSSKISGGGQQFKGSLDLGGDDSNIEFDGTLKYGANDPGLTGKNRQVIEAWEKKRAKNKIEYAYAVDRDGNPVGREIKGSKNHVRVPHSYHDTEGGNFTHIHPRGGGVLGGTFSFGDISNLINGRSKGTRAVAKEGTYSISKGQNFDGDGFKKYAAECNKAFDSNIKKLEKRVNGDYLSGKKTREESLRALRKGSNTELIKLHNAYEKGQKKYGYFYTLEQRN